MPIMPEVLAAVDDKLRTRYSSRLNSFGQDPKTLGWDTRENQFYRFQVAIEQLPSDRRISITDVGCGFADFKECLDASPINADYRGIDINPDLIAHASQRYPEVNFEVKNIVAENGSVPKTDWVSAFGVLNFKFSEFSNEEFSRRFIQEAFSLAKEGLIVDMLSCHYVPHYPPEDFVYYYNPAQMLDFALSLTPFVRLIHDYAPIPQREFMLVLKKGC